MTFSLSPADNHRLALLCGQFDDNLKRIERYFDVRISNRGAVFSIQGEPEPVERAERSLQELYTATAKDSDINEATVQRVLKNIGDGEQAEPAPQARIRTPKKQVRPQNERQQLYVDRIVTGDVCFGVGPAGTGKTFLAVACAVQALVQDEVHRIILCRPAVEAGERLGFLPGDIGQKVDPYLRPLYDALYECFGFEKVARLMEKNVIELAPLAYMRGRTLSDSFVILDEAQNTTIQQMLMFLTRIGFGSKAVITGDMTQTDLPPGTVSGLRHAVDTLAKVNGVSVTRFQSRDVVRHPLVQRIIEAYEADGQTRGQ
ncbi:MAG: PhoH family protein [Gammaproteobacteria bacterium]|nr:PhoH family protein [Gammaproteobacteria bacterium]